MKRRAKVKGNLNGGVMSSRGSQMIHRRSCAPSSDRFMLISGSVRLNINVSNK